MFPYAVQIAKSLQIDAVTLYAAGTESTADQVFSSNPSSVDIGTLTSGLNATTGSTPQQATLTLDADPKVMQPAQNQQVFVLIQYSFTVQT